MARETRWLFIPWGHFGRLTLLLGVMGIVGGGKAQNGIGEIERDKVGGSRHGDKRGDMGGVRRPPLDSACSALRFGGSYPARTISTERTSGDISTILYSSVSHHSQAISNFRPKGAVLTCIPGVDILTQLISDLQKNRDGRKYMTLILLVGFEVTSSRSTRLLDNL